MLAVNNKIRLLTDTAFSEHHCENYTNIQTLFTVALGLSDTQKK